MTVAHYLITSVITLMVFAALGAIGIDLSLPGVVPAIVGGPVVFIVLVWFIWFVYKDTRGKGGHRGQNTSHPRSRR